MGKRPKYKSENDQTAGENFRDLGLGKLFLDMHDL